MTSSPLPSDALADTELVALSLTGNRDAFGRIVERYQSLVCALAFSATGNVARSEDLAQETFLNAWRHLGDLREPAKLRPWLCGIVRTLSKAERRRLGCEPAVPAAEPTELDELPAGGQSLTAQVMSNEEVALMWREVGQLPENYREPFVLFYREHRSVTDVAAALELSEDAVMQRLSRARKLLHERMLVFVETALARTNPGKNFALGVQAALPTLAVGGQGAGLASAKGIAAKGGGLGAFALPFVGMLAALGVSWASVRYARDRDERRFMKIWNILLWSSIGAFVLGLRGVSAWGEYRQWDHATLLQGQTLVWTGYLAVLAVLLVANYRRTPAKDAPTVGSSPALLLSMYVATSAWMIGFAGMMGDGPTALILTVITALVGFRNWRQGRGQNAAAVHRLNFACHAVLCGVLVLTANLRVDDWLAALHQVPLDEMHRLLPMTRIHLLTLLVIAWTAGWLWLTRPARK